MFDIPKRPVENLWLLIAVDTMGRVGLQSRKIENELEELNHIRASLDVIEWLSEAPDWSMTGELYLFQGLRDTILEIGVPPELEIADCYNELMSQVFFSGFFKMPENEEGDYSQIGQYVAYELSTRAFMVQKRRDLKESVKFLLKGLL